MSARQFRRGVACLAGAILFGMAAPMPACSVPVFRYALERWAPDPYEVVIFHKGALTKSDRTAVALLEKGGFKQDVAANLDVVTVDLDDQPDAAMKALWQAERGPQLPWMVLRTPKVMKKQFRVWAGPLATANAVTVQSSPLRQEIVQKITKGESAVWVLLESGDKEKDDAAAKMLTEQLKKLKETLQLPELKANDPNDRIERGPDAPELKISFALLRLARSDAAEQPLVNMLLHADDDLLSLKDPMAFPIFGRGRALYALIGAGINEETIQDACTFVIGPCGCEVKRLNPGTDLLIAANWEGIFKGKAVEKPPTETTRVETPSSVSPPTQQLLPTPIQMPELSSAPPLSEPEAPDETATDGINSSLVLVLLLIVAGTATVAFSMGRWRWGR